MNSGQTKSEIEKAIRNAIIKFEQEFMGRGPDDVKTFVVRDIVVVRLKGVLTPAERQLAKTAEGIDMVKQLRQNLIALGSRQTLRASKQNYGRQDPRAFYRYRCENRRTGVRLYGRSRHSGRELIERARSLRKNCCGTVSRALG